MKLSIALVLVFAYSTSAELMSQAEFSAGVTANGFKAPTAAQYQAFVSNLAKALITTKLEACMMLAQVIVETGGLKYKEEIACAKTGCPTKYKDKCGVAGKHYYGRGYIQLTWACNYKKASQDLYKDDRLVKNPEQVGKDENVAWATAMYYWKTRVHNLKGVKEGHFGATTMGINPGQCKSASLRKQAQHRFEVYKKVLKAAKVTSTPNEKGCYN